MCSRVLLLLCCGVAGCHRVVAPPTESTLVGLTLPLIAGPGLRLAVEGSVGGRPAEVQFDVVSSIATVTSGCLDDAISGEVQVRLIDPMGEDVTFPVARVEGLVLAHRRYRPFQAAVINHPQCIVALGTDVLAGAALEVSPDRRTLALVPTRDRAAWLKAATESGEDIQLVELTKDPRHDWPLLAVRVIQGDAALTATFVVSSLERDSRVFEVAARQQGLKPGLELLAGIEVPEGFTIPPELEGLKGVPYERLELSPGYGVELGSLRLKQGAPPRGVAGVLAIDAWGRFEATLDLDANLLVLRRPRVLASGNRLQCERGGAFSEEACFVLSTSSSDGGITATGTVWRPLREGARLYLDTVPSSSLSCRIGLSFPAGDRGRSTQHTFPWSRLFSTMKGCAVALSSASDLTLSLFEDGNLKDCPGVCAFAQDLHTGMVSCECQSGGASGGDAEKRFIELYQQLLRGAPPPREPEPDDP